MNKKNFVLIMLVIPLFFQFLSGEIRPVRETHNIYQGTLAGNPGEPAAPLAQTYNSDGLWVFHVVENNPYRVWYFNAFILGKNAKIVSGVSQDLDGGFGGYIDINGNIITIESADDDWDLMETATGDVMSDDTMINGTWFYKGGNQAGTWTANRNSLPASPDFDIRGSWLIGFDTSYDPNITYPLKWLISFSGSKNGGVCDGIDLYFNGVKMVAFTQGNYSITGDRVNFDFYLTYVTHNNEVDHFVFDGKIINGNMLDGTNLNGQVTQTHNNGAPVQGSWAAILLAVPGNIPPFGSFDTPVDGAAVSGSIPVTGWALANRCVESVKIYLEYNSALLYVGDAVFIEGARPDIAEAYPSYLYAEKAGWGYMLLTNFLPDGGNGTYVLHAIATDRVGNTTTLGTKTIYCDNAHAVKPFGAIDTPAQGGTAAGSGFMNYGWVLTPQPNSIPIDGSTLNVYVDGVNIGHPTYNMYRSDVASLFPGYANSDGAGGAYTLDTTNYQNGLHTILWTAADSAGNVEGIGSRFFMIENPLPPEASAARQGYNGPILPVISSSLSEKFPGKTGDTFRYLEKSCSLSHLFQKGIQNEPGEDRSDNAQVSISDPGEIQKVTGKELDPLEISLGDNISEARGYLLVNHCLRDMPIGTTLDVRAGKFYWSPGPGFQGKYGFVFEIKDTEGRQYKKSVEITLEPKFKVKY